MKQSRKSRQGASAPARSNPAPPPTAEGCAVILTVVAGIIRRNKGE